MFYSIGNRTECINKPENHQCSARFTSEVHIVSCVKAGEVGPINANCDVYTAFFSQGERQVLPRVSHRSRSLPAVNPTNNSHAHECPRECRGIFPVADLQCSLKLLK